MVAGADSARMSWRTSNVACCSLVIGQEVASGCFVITEPWRSTVVPLSRQPVGFVFTQCGDTWKPTRARPGRFTGSMHTNVVKVTIAQSVSGPRLVLSRERAPTCQQRGCQCFRADQLDL